MAPYATEAEWIAALQANEAAAYEALVETFAEPVYRLAYRIVRNAADAEDVMQETFLRVYLHIGDFRGSTGLKSWLYRIATRQALAVLRRRQRKLEAATTVALDAEDDAEDAAWHERVADPAAWSPEAWAVAHETEACVRQAVEALPPTLRAALALHLFEDLPLTEVAAALEISHSAAKVRVHRARRALREALAPCLNAGAPAPTPTQEATA